MNLRLDFNPPPWLAGLDRRVLRFALAAVLALTVLEGWQLLLRAPWNEYRTLLGARRDAEHALHGISALPQDLVKVRADVQQLEASLAQGPGADLSAGGRSAVLMGELDQLAHSHHVSLLGVRPGSDGHIKGFLSTSQDVEARGRYADLLAWLVKIEQSLGPLVVSRVKLTSRSPDDPLLSVQFSITAYRMSETRGGPP